jgi:hypothetical protein
VAVAKERHQSGTLARGGGFLRAGSTGSTGSTGDVNAAATVPRHPYPWANSRRGTLGSTRRSRRVRSYNHSRDFGIPGGLARLRQHRKPGSAERTHPMITPNAACHTPPDRVALDRVTRTAALDLVTWVAPKQRLWRKFRDA